jgi:hypothetical protein
MLVRVTKVPPTPPAVGVPPGPVTPVPARFRSMGREVAVKTLVVWFGGNSGP